MNDLPSSNFHQIYSHSHQVFHVLAWAMLRVVWGCDRCTVTLLPATNWFKMLQSPQRKTAETYYPLRSNFNGSYWTPWPKSNNHWIFLSQKGIFFLDSLLYSLWEEGNVTVPNWAQVEKSLIGEHTFLMNPSPQIFQYLI